MTRRKVKLAFISNESSRKATFKKRKKGFIKKVSELATLCGIKACAVLYSPYDSGPVVWPSNAGVQSVVGEFRALPTMDQERKMVDQEAFLRQRIAKASQYLKKQKKENREMEMTQVMLQSLFGNLGRFPLSIRDLNDLGYLADQHLKDVNRRIELLQNAGMEIGESSNAGMEIGGSSNVVAIGPGGGEMMARMAAATPHDDTTLNVGSSSSSLAANGFFNQLNFLHLTTPHVGFHEHSRNLNLNQNQQPWSMETMNHPEQMRYRPEQEFPFMDDNNRNHHIYHQLHHQHLAGESSNDPAIVSSSGNTPIMDPSLSNNLWFR